ncbi:porin [Noviherbaspirillum sp.]|uniref:porin n=1 Tax=Noviherbaspirillum sp. TaxID=1926288 RepID=UPI002B494B66|nr:porin [Noviherbaspirillum sp.]HJV82023.1 porin [Noviherbaspirillum sp.]
MKKSLLAIAVFGVFAGAASAQTNVTIYGVADAGIRYRDNGASTNSKTWGLDSGLQSGSRIGFKGSEDLGGGLSALFTLETGFNIDDGSLGQGIAASTSTPALTRLFGRQAFVGLSGRFGAVKLGRQYAPIRVALESIDPFGLGGAGNAANVFNVHGERTDNTLNYTTANIGGFSGQLAYSFGEIAGDNSAGRQIGVSGGYANGPLNIVVAYHKQNLLGGGTATAFPATPAGDAKTTMLGGTYDFGVAKLHAAYSRTKGESAAGVTNLDRDDAMIGVSAPVGAGTILASYILRRDDIAGTGGTSRDANQIALGYLHNLSKRTNLYTMYARTTNDAGATLNGAASAGADPSTFMVGVRHRF